MLRVKSVSVSAAKQIRPRPTCAQIGHAVAAEEQRGFMLEIAVWARAERLVVTKAAEMRTASVLALRLKYRPGSPFRVTELDSPLAVRQVFDVIGNDVDLRRVLQLTWSAAERCVSSGFCELTSMPTRFSMMARMIGIMPEETMTTLREKKRSAVMAQAPGQATHGTLCALHHSKKTLKPGSSLISGDEGS